MPMLKTPTPTPTRAWIVRSRRLFLVGNVFIFALMMALALFVSLVASASASASDFGGDALYIPLSPGRHHRHHRNLLGSGGARESLASDKLHFAYTGKVSVGSKNFDIVFDTGSSDFWLTGEECDDCDDVPVSERLSCKGGVCEEYGLESCARTACEWKSSLCVCTDSYGSGSVKLALHRVTAGFGSSLVAQNITVGSAFDFSASIEEIGLYGIVGLAFRNGAKYTFNNPVLTALDDAGMHRSFSFYLSHVKYDTKDENSMLIMGGFDEKYISPKASWRNVSIVRTTASLGYFYWAVELKGYAFGGGKTPVSHLAILDTGTSKIFITPLMYEAFLEALPGGAASIVHDENGNAYCPACKSDPKLAPGIDFYIAPHGSSEPFTVHPQYYLDCAFGDGCLIKVDSNEREDDVIILGVPFLQTYYSYWMADEKVVSLARASVIDRSKPPKNTVEFVLLICGAILLAGSLIGIIYVNRHQIYRTAMSRFKHREPILSIGLEESMLTGAETADRRDECDPSSVPSSDDDEDEHDDDFHDGDAQRVAALKQRDVTMSFCEDEYTKL